MKRSLRLGVRLVPDANDLRLMALADFSLDFSLFSEYLNDKKGIEFPTVPD